MTVNTPQPLEINLPMSAREVRRIAYSFGVQPGWSVLDITTTADIAPLEWCRIVGETGTVFVYSPDPEILEDARRWSQSLARAAAEENGLPSLVVVDNLNQLKNLKIDFVVVRGLYSGQEMTKFLQTNLRDYRIAVNVVSLITSGSPRIQKTLQKVLKPRAVYDWCSSYCRLLHDEERSLRLLDILIDAYIIAASNSEYRGLEDMKDLAPDLLDALRAAGSKERLVVELAPHLMPPRCLHSTIAEAHSNNKKDNKQNSGKAPRPRIIIERGIVGIVKL